MTTRIKWGQGIQVGIERLVELKGLKVLNMSDLAEVIIPLPSNYPAHLLILQIIEV